MRHPKMCVGLFAVALAIGAFGGAGAASARICSTSGSGVSCGGSYGKVYSGAFSATALKSEFTSTFDNVSCSESTMGGSVTNGELGSIQVTSLAFGKCVDSFGSSCTGSSPVSGGNPSSGSVSASTPPWGWTNLTLTIQFTCPVFGVNTTCKYTTPGISMEVGGLEGIATFKVNSSMSKEEGSGGACSSAANWKSTYTIGSPSSFFVT
jgi:hypothetical protein